MLGAEAVTLSTACASAGGVVCRLCDSHTHSRSIPQANGPLPRPFYGPGRLWIFQRRPQFTITGIYKMTS